MQTNPPRKHTHEKPVTLWIPVELVALLDEKVSAEQARLRASGARISRHGLISAAIRKFVVESSMENS